MKFEFGFIGHCYDTSAGHDKIWGYFYRPTSSPLRHIHKRSGWNCCIFWGRRGKQLRFKMDVTGRELDSLCHTKTRNGYDEISEATLFTLWPSFIKDAEGKLICEILAGTVQ